MHSTRTRAIAAAAMAVGALSLGASATKGFVRQQVGVIEDSKVNANTDAAATDAHRRHARPE